MGCYKLDVSQILGLQLFSCKSGILGSSSVNNNIDVWLLGLKMACHVWPIIRGCKVPPLWQQQQCRTAASTNQCHYTFDVCGPCFVLPGELKNHKISMNGENSQSQQVYSHRKFCDSCDVDFNIQHHNDAGKDE